jgi:hypothetical protein
VIIFPPYDDPTRRPPIYVASITLPRYASHAAFRPGQLGPVKAKFLADAAYNARVKDLARSAKRNFRLPPLVMDYHHDWALSSFLMPVVETTSAVG